VLVGRELHAVLVPDLVESVYGVGCSQMWTVGLSNCCGETHLVWAGFTYAYNPSLVLEGTWVRIHLVLPVAAGFCASEVGLVLHHNVNCPSSSVEADSPLKGMS
jgi:hypothetical protein